MKKIIVANWKMNPKNLDDAKRLAMAWEHRMHAMEHVQVVIAAPFIYLPPLKHYTNYTSLGAQNMSWAEEGAFTGEISPLQLKQWDVQYVILGHSERRIYLGETDSVVNAKIQTALNNKITPIVCLGGEEGAVKGEMKTLVTKQFIKCTKGLDEKQLLKIIYAYEPIWAISTMKNSKPADGAHAAELIDHIFALIGKKTGKEAARNAKVIYGGTVNKNNVAEYAKYPQIDGALVGSASLDSENFWNIVKEFNREAIHKL